MLRISHSRLLFPATLALTVLSGALCISGLWNHSSTTHLPYLLTILTTVNLAVFAILFEIVKRVRRLRNEVSAIAKANDVTLRVTSEGNDEIYDLANNINVFLSALESAQEFLVVAREAAETADRTKSLLIDELRRRDSATAFPRRSPAEAPGKIHGSPGTPD